MEAIKNNSKIKSLKAREILDSKERPTVEVVLETDFGRFSAKVPSGVSTGKYEAIEIRDKDGNGVKKAIENIRNIIEPVLGKEPLDDQKRIDNILIELDGTENKSALGANAILPVSLAVCRALAKKANLFLYQYISQLAENGFQQTLPKPSFNMIEGGKHVAETSLAFQEFMALPKINNFEENFKIGKEIYGKLKEILEKEFGKENIGLSAEGAYSTPIKKVEKALSVLSEAIKEVGRLNDVSIALDAAASEFHKDGNYALDGEIISKDGLLKVYENLIKNYPIISIEDPFFEEDFSSFSKIENKIGDTVLIFGDDLTVSNKERIKMAKESDSCSGLILKPNQIGTVTETIEAAKLAKSYGWKIMVSNRAGETEDDFIADLAVGVGAEFIKSGAPFPKERLAKYNRLVTIEESIK